MSTELLLAAGVGALCGAAVGTERQWSGHADGKDAHFGGLRTFTLLGLIGGVAGWLWVTGAVVASALLLGGALALVVAAYVSPPRFCFWSRRRDCTPSCVSLMIAGFAPAPVSP